MSASETLSDSQLRALSIVERTCSVFSLLGSVFIITTFVSSKAFHKPINRLVFYASFGNMLTNVGTLMSRHYIGSPESVGCQFQAFLIQMFMPADAFWSLSMAINVYLTFYFKFDAQRLRKMEIPYLIGCYGVPFVPAVVYIFIKNKEGQRMYGTIKTTEVSVTTEAMTPNAIHLQPMSRQPPDPSDPNSNGIYSVHISAHGNSRDIAGEGVPIERQQTRVSVAVPQQRSGGNPARRRNRELNNASWQYTKCALLFFTAILITWVPSSANRVYSVLNTKSTSVPLEFMSAFVLPLQGFWNALIYMVTSWSACKNLFTDLRQGRRPHLTELMDGMAPDIGGNNHPRRHNLPQFRANTTSNKFETESMTELANESRPTSDDGRQDHLHV
ncbi:hypothetical protein FPRO04_14319 [Fusarium proliferatum]|nr:hypothetical protein FPRO04_14319 [Fusarium proliferatum]